MTEIEKIKNGEEAALDIIGLSARGLGNPWVSQGQHMMRAGRQGGTSFLLIKARTESWKKKEPTRSTANYWIYYNQ